MNPNYIKTLIILLLVTTNVYSQVFKNYTVEDGLPSSEVHFSLQDSKGYMWFATDAGVSRFNGYEFENFDTEDGLTDNTVFRILEDRRGRIWFATFNGRFCYYENGIIKEYKYNKGAKAIVGMDKLIDFHIDQEDNIWVGTWRGGYKVDLEGVTLLSQSRDSNEVIINSFRIDSVQYLYGLPVLESQAQPSYKISVKLGLDSIFYEDKIEISNFMEKTGSNGMGSYVLRSLYSSKDLIVLDNNPDHELYVYDIHNKEVNKRVYDISLVKNKDLTFIKFFQNYLWISLKEEGGRFNKQVQVYCFQFQS